MSKSRLIRPVSRRAVVRSGARLGAGAVAAAVLARTGFAQAPAVVTSDRTRPQMPLGVQSGDMAGDRAVVWSKTDRPARLTVEWSTTESFRNAHRIVGPAALEIDDFTARVDLSGLPPGQQIFYRAMFQDLPAPTTPTAPMSGGFHTAPGRRRGRIS